MHWYIPSFYGDINLKPGDAENTTVLETRKLTPTESQALAKLETVSRSKNWIDATAVLPVQGEAVIRAPIEKVAKLLAKHMKPDRQLVTAVKFSGGAMQEIREGKLPGGSEAAATVAAPTRGCPAPDFESAEIRATRVLEQFLTPRQTSDFRAYNRFVVRGADSGHDYMVTSRHARDSLAQYQRSLFDLEANRPICVHDWTIPAAEEMLTLSMLLQLPGWEHWMLQLPDELEEAALSPVTSVFVCPRTN
jgi:hypothetical protein